ncbi:MAG: hypothetical protein QM817_10685 [Archangium sp.]
MTKYVVLGLALFSSGCVSPLTRLKVEKPLALEGAQFVLKSDGKSDRDVARIEQALQRVPSMLERWGTISAPVTVYVVPLHEDLEAAVGRPGFGWLRAWAHFDDVIFQAPSTWTTSQEVVDELVVHEVTHCLLFQASGDSTTWLSRHIPLWFREGMAIVTAHQQRRYPSLEDTARWLESNPDLNPFEDGERLSKRNSAEVYGVGVHAFELLEEKVGAAKIRELMAAMHGGEDFEGAFAKALGTTLDAFLREFRAFLKARQFRDTHQSVPAR